MSTLMICLQVCPLKSSDSAFNGDQRLKLSFQVILMSF